jgi:hypothetical protein
MLLLERHAQVGQALEELGLVRAGRQGRQQHLQGRRLGGGAPWLRASPLLVGSHGGHAAPDGGATLQRRLLLGVLLHAARRL